MFIVNITSLFLNKKLRYCYVILCVTRAVHEKSGGFVNAGGWGTRKLARHFHAASTRRDKNTRLAWNSPGSNELSLLTVFAGIKHISQSSVHTLSTFLRICADPSMQIFCVSVTVALSDTFLIFSIIPFFIVPSALTTHWNHFSFHMPHSLYF